MSEIYKQKEWELRNKMEDIDTISGTFENYVEEVDRFIEYLLNDTKEINVLRSENKQLHSIIKEVREYIIQEANNINAITYINILEILDKVGVENDTN